MSKLKFAGAWSGVVEVDLEAWTVANLKEEVARRSGTEADSINLICAGKVMKNSGESLAQLGVKSNAKIMAVKVCSAEEGKSFKTEMIAEEERTTRLARVKAAAAAISKRHTDGSLSFEEQTIELEDQSGRSVNLGTDNDKQAIMMGLMLHTDAKKLIGKKKYKDALEILAMGEESFNLCDPKILEFIDNPPILQIDMVWCYFMLQDLSWLSVAGQRLEKARKDIERSHGKDSFRIKLLQGGRQPELALHLRMELLEGVIAYHSAQFVKSKKALISAHEKYNLLQVPDEALSLVMSMGFREREAKRALRMSNQDIGSAVDFLVEQKAQSLQKRKEFLQQQKDIKELQKYGKTALKKLVDMQRLNELVSIGFEKELAAEALRRNENNTQKALDDLTNPDINSSIQHIIESRKQKRLEKETESIEKFVHMGFERSLVAEAFGAGGTVEQVMQRVLSLTNNGADVSEQARQQLLSLANNVASSSAPQTQDNVDAELAPETEEGRDVEMEDELADELARVDALTDYDLDVTREGEAITEYLAMLESAGE